MSIIRDPFFDGGEIGFTEQPPTPPTRKRLSSDIKPIETIEDPTATPRSPTPLTISQPETTHGEAHESRVSHRRASKSASIEFDVDDDEEEQKGKEKYTKTTPPSQPETIHGEAHESRASFHRSSKSVSFESDINDDEEEKEKYTKTTPPPQPTPLPISQPETVHGEAHESRESSRRSSKSASFESDIDDDEEEQKGKEKYTKTTRPRTTADIDIQTDRVAVRDESIQTEADNDTPLLKTTIRKVVTLSESKKFIIPSAKNLFDQTITSALPIISFCQPFSMTSRMNDIILAMPRHLMIVNNQNSVSVYPWQPQYQSTSTILECFWCSFLYKLLVTTVEDSCLFIYDFVSIIDSIKLRGHPLSIKTQSHQSRSGNSSFLLPASARHQPLPVVWTQTRFTKSNSLGIYYCYLSDRHYSSMLTRIDHNTRQHIKAIDCSGGSLNNARVCAMGLSDERVAIVLTNLIMTLYNAETLIGLKQINLSSWNGYHIRSVSAVIYLWKTWLLFDPIDNKVVGIGKPKRQFTKILPEQPTNACTMDNGTLALWLGYPGALFYYRLVG